MTYETWCPGDSPGCLATPLVRAVAKGHYDKVLPLENEARDPKRRGQLHLLDGDGELQGGHQ